MTLRIALLATVALLPAVASAQTYSRIITFGDSLSDNGNLLAVAGTPPAPYYLGRFSNGPVWVERLNGPMLAVGPTILGVPPSPALLPVTANLNFAFGGARTDAAVAVPPGTVTQVTNYLGLGGKVSSTDLVTLWGGANDLLQGIPAAAANPTTAAATMAGVATTAAGNIGAQVGTLARAGAGTVLTLNLPDLGQAPAFTAQGPSAMALASYSAGTFNNAWASTTAAAAAANPKTNVIQVPVDQLFASVLANPGAYGFANVTSQCIQTLACVTGTPATQNTYLFWDGVHPTAAGHAILANFVGQYLFAPARAAEMAATADVGFWSRRQGAADMIDRLAAANPGNKTEWFVSVIGEQGKRDVANLRSGFTITGTSYSSPYSARYAAGGLRFGGFRALDPAWTVGLGFSATAGEAKSGSVSFTPVAFAADAVARWASGPFFVNLGAGAQMNHYGDIERKLGIINAVNKTSLWGWSASATAEAGYRFDMGAFAVVPKARLAYIWSHSGGGQEVGLFAPFRYEGRSVSGLAGGGEVRFEAKFSGATAHAVAGYETFLTGKSGDLRGRIVNNSASPFFVKMADPVGAGLLLGGGIDATFGNWKAGVIYRATIGNKSQVTHRGGVTVSATF